MMKHALFIRTLNMGLLAGRQRKRSSPAGACLFICICIICLAMPRAAYALCSCAYDDGQFSLDQGIVIDGSMADWAPVWADPDNNACDGGAGGIEPQPDLDAPAPPADEDIIHFAFTWDSSGIYVYIERVDSAKGNQEFTFYVDADNDGLMETGEPVIFVQWNGKKRDVKIFVGAYVESAPGGDSMVDGGGYADGYSLPGTATFGAPSYKGKWGSADGLTMEWMIPWVDLGLAPGTAFTYHLSSASDNMAGCGGGAGSTQYAGLTFSPDQYIQTTQLTTVYAAHTLTHTGNGNDTFDFSSTISGDFTPTVSYYNDADGSGTFTAGDTLLTDTDGDGVTDTGLLIPGASIDILIAYTVGAVSPGVASIVTTAASSFDPNTSQFVTDTVAVVLFPDIITVKSVVVYSDPINGTTNPKAIPGAQMLYTIQVTNQGVGAADTDTTVVIDSIPANTQMYVAGAPIDFVDGATPSGLTYTFTSLSSTTDDVDFSNDGGATYTYTPTPDADGYDSAVTNIRVNPKGQFDASDGVNNPSFEIRFRVRVI